jgi:hypothetical protein
MTTLSFCPCIGAGDAITGAKPPSAADPSR